MTTPRTMADLVALFLSGGLAGLSGQPDPGPDLTVPVAVNGMNGAARPARAPDARPVLVEVAGR